MSRHGKANLAKLVAFSHTVLDMPQSAATRAACTTRHTGHGPTVWLCDEHNMLLELCGAGNPTTQIADPVL